MTSAVLEPRLRQLIDDFFGVPVGETTEDAGEQGASGAQVHYFRTRVDGAEQRFVVKTATALERRILSLLQEQGQAVPRSMCSTSTPGRDWLIMEHVDEIAYGDSATGTWPERLGAALAEVHLTNLGRRPDWLPSLPAENPLRAVYADEWRDAYAALIATNAEFRSRYGSLEKGLDASWQTFQLAVDAELAHPEQHTLISTDMTPSHWRQKAGRPVLIDWEQARYGPLYLDLPNLFDHVSVKHYYRALVERGAEIPQDEFADRFASLSRYLGFRYLSVGLDFWSGTNRLGWDYWKSSGARFFEQCLQVARFGYPRPDLG